MYAASARLTAATCRRYGIPVDRKHILGHVEVPGTDHTDPGPHWDWDRYIRLVRKEGVSTVTHS
jgi:N-acetyl-anhydromuramyl-L-alanine amidase AmpD